MVTMNEAIELAKQVKQDLTRVADECNMSLIDLGIKDLYEKADRFLTNAGVQ